jgi:uncharacterized membrane protein YdbT with pleckstrin-like domain
MAFSKSHLNDGEEVILDLHPHWFFLFPRGSLLLGALFVGVWLLLVSGEGFGSSVVNVLVSVLLVGAVIWFVMRVVEWLSTEFVVTTDRCIYRSGILTKRGIEIPLDRINTVFFNQTLLERMISSGDIGIESAGENSQQKFSNIMNPLNVQRTIYHEIEEYENRRQDRLGRVVGGHASAGHSDSSGGSTLSTSEQLEKLHELRERGGLTDAEYEAEKAKLLGG